MKTLCLITIEDDRGKGWQKILCSRQEMYAQFAMSVPFNRAIGVRPALFSTFLVSQCVAAGCELFASIGFIIIIYQGDE